MSAILQLRKQRRRYASEPDADQGDDGAAHGLRDRLRGRIKCLIVTAACCWGFPASWAQWLIQRGGFLDA